MFNTLSYARKLESVGVSRDQAEAHVQIIAEIVEGDLATKQDIEDTRQEIRELRVELVNSENRLFIKLGALTAGLVTLAVGIIAMLIQNR